MDKCFACGKRLVLTKRSSHLVVTIDGQTVYVGPDCYRKVDAAGHEGYQPPPIGPLGLGGPKLYIITSNTLDEFRKLSHSEWLFGRWPETMNKSRQEDHS